LSMPRTISSSERVMKASHRCGSASTAALRPYGYGR
jgi:hypothetical protein